MPKWNPLDFAGDILGAGASLYEGHQNRKFQKELMERERERQARNRGAYDQYASDYGDFQGGLRDRAGALGVLGPQTSTMEQLVNSLSQHRYKGFDPGADRRLQGALEGRAFRPDNALLGELRGALSAAGAAGDASVEAERNRALKYGGPQKIDEVTGAAGRARSQALAGTARQVSLDQDQRRMMDLSALQGELQRKAGYDDRTRTQTTGSQTNPLSMGDLLGFERAAYAPIDPYFESAAAPPSGPGGSMLPGGLALAGGLYDAYRNRPRGGVDILPTQSYDPSRLGIS